MLRISLLGGFLIEYEGKSLPPISSAAGRSLLAYLITHRGRWHTRDLLAGTFWPERSESSARKRLSQALWQIQTALRSADADESTLGVTPNQVSFNADQGTYWLDVEEFERITDSAETSYPDLASSVDGLERAVALYRGDFLAGFYDDWMLLERERLSSLYRHTLERLVALHKARSDYRAALSHARRLVVEDPVRESAHREVMRLNFLLGSSTEALQQYERCRAILQEEFHVEPSAKTRGLRDEIAQLRDKGDRPFVPSFDAPLIGDPRKIPLIARSTERAAIVRRIEDSLVGRGSVVLIEGESGIGKTRLLNELVDDAHWRGVNVLWARADHQTQGRPYLTIGKALRSGLTRLRARQLAEILDESLLAGVNRVTAGLEGFIVSPPDSWDLPPDETRAWMKRSLQHALIGLGELGAHVLFIDDAHWIDPESLDVIDGLVEDIEKAPLVVLLAYRSDEARDSDQVWRTLMHIDEQSHPYRVTLGSLTFEDTSLLIEEASGAIVSSSVAEGIFHETGGNPLFILETLRTMREATDQILDDDPGGQSDGIEEVASGVTRVIERRLRNLDASARVVLNAAAILGSHFDADLLTRMSRLEPSETLKGLSHLVQRGIIVELTDGYEFSHQQMNVVAGDSIRRPERKRLHRAAALALEAEHPERIEDLAYHYSAAGMADQAMHLAWQAGSRAVTLASYESAARYLREAVTWAHREPPAPADFFELLCDLEGVLEVLGEREEQIELVDLMDDVASGDPAMVAEATRRRSDALARLGRHGEALDTAEQALESARDSGRPEVLSAVERTIGAVHSMAGRPAKAIPHLERAVALIAGRSVEEADVRRALGDVLTDLQSYDLASHQLEVALLLYEESGNMRGVADAKSLLGILSMEQGLTEKAEDFYLQAMELAQRIAYRRAEAASLGNLANLHYLRGHIDVALDESGRAAETFLSIGDRRGAALAYANAASVRHLILGEDDKAESDARSALEFFEGESHEWGTAFCLEIIAGIAERRGDSAQAMDLLERALSLVADSQHRWLEVHVLRHLAQVELALGRTASSRDRLERAEDLCRKLGLTDVLPTVEGLASQVEYTEGRLQEALALARRATADLTETAEQPYQVWYQRYLAESAAGNGAEAEMALGEAWRMLNETLAHLPEPDRERALSSVPINHDIVESRRKSWPETVRVRLPRDDIPRGRHLEDGDKVEVRWTISDPADFAIPDRIDRRRHQICRLMDEARSQSASPRVVDLAHVLRISEATLRRDITALRQAGNHVATRGSCLG